MKHIEQGIQILLKKVNDLEKDKKDLIEVLLENLRENICYYSCLPNSHRYTAEEYYAPEIGLLERLTGKTWKEIQENRE